MPASRDGQKIPRFTLSRCMKFTQESERLVNAGQAKICYIYRNIRDVAVSLRLKRGLTFEKIMGELSTAISEYEAAVKIPGVLVQKYETIMLDLVEAVEELAAFLHIQVDPGICRQIADECSVQRAESVANDLKYKLAFDLSGKTTRQIDEILSPNLDSKTLLHPNHISKNIGASGVWKTQLSRQEKQAIMSNFSGWLLENEYLGGLVDASTGFDPLSSYVAGKSDFIDPVIGCVSIETSENQWAYGAVLTLNRPTKEAEEYLVVVEIFVMRGSIGLGLLNKAEDAFLYRKKSGGVRRNSQSIHLYI